MIYFIFSPIFIFLMLLLAIYIYFENRKQKINIIFSLLILNATFWIFSNFMADISKNGIQNLFWSRISLIGPILIAYFFYLFSLIFPRSKIIKFPYDKIIFAIAIIFIILSFTQLNIKNVQLITNGTFQIITGPLYIFFLIYFLLIIGWSLINIFRNYKTFTEIEWTQTYLIIIGIILATIFGLITNLILPIFNNSQFISFGPYSIIFFIFFTFYAIIKHQLFNIKVIATELLVFAIWVVTLIEFLLEENLRGQLLTGGLFIFMIIAGILLIRSVMKEVEQKEKIEKLSKYKSELLSIVSHQIKNPLAVVKGYATLIGDNTIVDSVKIRETSLKIKAATNKLLDLLANLLDFGHIEDGKMHYNFQQIDLNKMLKETIDDFSFLAQQKNLQITFEPASQDIFISGDNYKLLQVFRNLIDNSIKYTPSGWIKTKIIIANDPQLSSNNEVLVEISDSGRGMSKELTEKLFSKFTRGGDEGQILGSGLGLYICKQIVEDHGGKIWAESDGESKGSRFLVKLSINKN